jgi:hypothetical protein
VKFDLLTDKSLGLKIAGQIVPVRRFVFAGAPDPLGEDVIRVKAPIQPT